MLSLIIASVVNFILLMAILIYFGRKPILAFLQARHDSVAATIQQVSKEYEGAHASRQQWEAKWSNAEGEFEAQKKDAQAAVVRQRDAALKNAEHEAKRIHQEAALASESEQSKARNLLINEMVSKSVSVAEGYLRTHLKEADNHMLVEQYVESLNG